MTQTVACLKWYENTWAPSATELPPTVTPPGLSNKRQWYLFNDIREFCREGTEDLACPLPLNAPELDDQTAEEPAASATASPTPKCAVR